jgi:hypothetical protein
MRTFVFISHLLNDQDRMAVIGSRIAIRSTTEARAETRVACFEIEEVLEICDRPPA